jgi:hypothetical protein
VEQVTLADAPGNTVVVVLDVEDALVAVLGADVVHCAGRILFAADEAFQTEYVVHAVSLLILYFADAR